MVIFSKTWICCNKKHNCIYIPESSLICPGEPLVQLYCWIHIFFWVLFLDNKTCNLYWVKPMLHKETTFLYNNFNFIVIKRTVSVISSDPSCKDRNSRFTTVPLKSKNNIIKNTFNSIKTTPGSTLLITGNSGAREYRTWRKRRVTCKQEMRKSLSRRNANESKLFK